MGVCGWTTIPSSGLELGREEYLAAGRDRQRECGKEEEGEREGANTATHPLCVLVSWVCVYECYGLLLLLLLLLLLWPPSLFERRPTGCRKPKK